jgi:hypothetical protein
MREKGEEPRTAQQHCRGGGLLGILDAEEETDKKIAAII